MVLLRSHVQHGHDASAPLSVLLHALATVRSISSSAMHSHRSVAGSIAGDISR